MSEPVGNAPRTPGDIPPNTHKSIGEKQAEKIETEAAPKEPMKQVTQGNVTKRKTPWYKRAVRGLVAEDVSSMREWVMIEVVIPSIRNLISDTVKGSTDRILYGQARARTRGLGVGVGGDRPGLRTRYDKMADGGEPRRSLTREARARHDFDDVVLDSHAEAVIVVESLIERVETYGAASVADMYDLVGVTGSYADRSYGWTDLRTADVRQVRGGFLLDLPQPILLR